MSLKLTPKLLLAGFVLASVIAFGSFYVVAQNGSGSSATFSDEISLQGTVQSIDDDHGFTMLVGSDTYFVGNPYTYDTNDLGITVGATVSVTGYIVDSPMMDSSSYIMFHATSVNGITIDHTPQNQAGSGNCGGMGNGNGFMGHGPHH